LIVIQDIVFAVKIQYPMIKTTRYVINAAMAPLKKTIGFAINAAWGFKIFRLNIRYAALVMIVRYPRQSRKLERRPVQP
jgi:hypothetical protein